MKKAESFDENQAQNELKKGYKKAEILLHDENKLEIFLQKIENKLTIVPIVGNALSYIPVMISMIYRNTYRINNINDQRINLFCISS